MPEALTRALNLYSYYPKIERLPFEYVITMVSAMTLLFPILLREQFRYTLMT